MEKRAAGWTIAMLCGALALFFLLLFYADNKYETPPPYGRDGVIELTAADLTRETPVFLIDGWLLSDDRVTNQPTWIGEFSNLRRGTAMAPPHGAASYRLTLRYSGPPMNLSAAFPELRCNYRILLNGGMLASGQGSVTVDFPLHEGDQTLTVETFSQSGYYSGMYYPPALGQPQTIDKIGLTRTFAYALALLTPLVLALFTFCLWSRRDDPTAFWFGVICCCFSAYVGWYFVGMFHLPFWGQWYLAEELALCGLCFAVVRLTALAAGKGKSRACRLAQWALIGWTAGLVTLSLLIGSVPGASALHGLCKNLYFLLVFGWVVFFAAGCKPGRRREERFILAGDTVFGAGLILNLFFSNRFEPIRFFWQFEWCGLLLVGLFGGMMTARNRRILTENAKLTGHLEQLVERRTEELQRVLQERKAFFADMAHDLKAPLFATKGFIDAIRKNNTGVDGELAYYLEQAEQKQMEMARRLQGLSAVNALDKIEEPKQAVSVQALLAEVYAAHHAQAEVASVHLRIGEMAEDCMLFAQPQKLEILFENLIFNALRATGPEGNISVSAERTGDRVCIGVADTGCGIPAEELPYLFGRFFVGARNKGTGTGLGLYIAQTIVTELGGEISVQSTPGEGTAFRIDFPVWEG